VTFFVHSLLGTFQEAAEAKEAEGALRSEVKEARGQRSYDTLEVIKTLSFFLFPFRNDDSKSLKSVINSFGPDDMPSFLLTHIHVGNIFRFKIGPKP